MLERSTREQTIARLFFSAILCALTLTAYFIPYYEWDLVAYVGSAIALHEHNAKSIQAQAYRAVRNEIPDDEYADIATGSDFRRDAANNSDHFFQQLRFYQIRPLYIRLLGILHGAGIGYVNATRLISAGAFAGMGFLLFVWAGKYVGQMKAAICVSLLLITPVVFTSARTGSPDEISGLFVLLGTFLLIEHRWLGPAALFLLLSLFLRTDNLIFVVLLLAWMALRAASIRERLIAAGSSILAVGIFWGINHFAHSYSWAVLMQNTTNPIPNPAELHPKFELANYLQAIYDMLDETRESSILVFPFIAALAGFSSRTPRALKELAAVVILSWLAHIMLFPHIEDRYFVAGSTLIGIAGISALVFRPNHDTKSQSAA